MLNIDFNNIRPIKGLQMRDLKNSFVSWHVKRKFHVKRNLNAAENQMEAWNVIKFLKMEVLWPGKPNIFVRLLMIHSINKLIGRLMRR